MLTGVYGRDQLEDGWKVSDPWVHEMVACLSSKGWHQVTCHPVTRQQISSILDGRL